MIIKKITSGDVVQLFDTSTQKFLSQTFVAGDEVTYENEDGDSVEPFEEEYLPFTMVQPDDV